MINNTDNLVQFTDMIKIMEEDLEGTLHIAKVDMNRLFLVGETSDGEQNELMLRINPLTKKLVVARINFIHQRAGYGTQLLEVLKNYAKEHNYEIIQFESVLSDSMKAFLIKNGFSLASNYDYEMNWNLKL